MIPPFYDLIQRRRREIPQAALVIDAREGRFLEAFPEILQPAAASGPVPGQLLVLRVFRRRPQAPFQRDRRPHPLAGPSGRRSRTAIARSAKSWRRCARWPIASSTPPVHRAPVAPLPQERVRPHRCDPGTGRQRGLVRFQVRSAVGGRPGVRRAVPAQPVFRRGVAGARTAPNEDVRRSSSTSNRQTRNSSSDSKSCSSSWCRCYAAEGQELSDRGESGAPAASIARWRSPSGWANTCPNRRR